MLARKISYSKLSGFTRRIILTRKTHHVVPSSDAGWDGKKGGGKRTIKHFDKKQDAVDYGRGVSKNQESEFIVHKKDGTIKNPIVMAATHFRQKTKGEGTVMKTTDNRNQCTSQAVRIDKLFVTTA